MYCLSFSATSEIKCVFNDASNNAGVLDVIHVMVQCGRPVGQPVLKIQSEVLLFPPLSCVGIAH